MIFRLLILGNKKLIKIESGLVYDGVKFYLFWIIIINNIKVNTCIAHIPTRYS